MGTEDAKFLDWMRRVDAILLRRFGFTHDDLADYSYRDLFEDGFTPAQAVKLVLEEGGY